MDGELLLEHTGYLNALFDSKETLEDEDNCMLNDIHNVKEGRNCSELRLPEKFKAEASVLYIACM